MGLYQTVRSFLTHPLVAGPVIGGIVVLLAYADSKLRDIKREKETYYKLFAVTSLIAALVVYLVVEEFTKTDEFLNQRYETELPGGMLDGHTITVQRQQTMSGPQTSVDALENLVPGDIDRVTMRSERIPPELKSSKHRSSGKHKSSRRHKSSRM